MITIELAMIPKIHNELNGSRMVIASDIYNECIDFIIHPCNMIYILHEAFFHLNKQKLGPSIKEDLTKHFTRDKSLLIIHNNRKRFKTFCTNNR